jgi:hypothetical protein
MLLVRSYRTFAPLPKKINLSRRYFSVALSSRSLALGVTQQVWFLRSPDFPQDQFALTSQPPRRLSLYPILGEFASNSRATCNIHNERQNYSWVFLMFDEIVPIAKSSGSVGHNC